jgi:rhodanese-related sulfurtransferase
MVSGGGRGDRNMRFKGCKLTVLAVLIVALVLCGGCALPTPVPTPQPSVTPAVKNISSQEVLDFINKNQSNPNFMIIDVRTAEEFAAGHIAKAINIDVQLAGFESNVSKLDRNKRYLVYCRTGVRSATATQTMAGLGFKDIYNLSGGLSQLIQDGYQVVK